MPDDDLRVLVARWDAEMRACPTCRRFPLTSPHRCLRCLTTAIHIEEIEALLARRGEPIAGGPRMNL